MSPISVQVLVKGLEDAANRELKSQLRQTIKTDNADLTQYLDGLVAASAEAANRINVATGYFIANEFKLKPKFLQSKSGSSIETKTIDPSDPVGSSDIVNKWVSEKTRGVINEVVKPQDVSSALGLLLLNAIHFKGQWKYKFTNTTDAEYEASPGVPKTVPQMYQYSKLCSSQLFRDNEDKSPLGRWVELPYDEDKLSMLLILPKERHTLEEMIQKMTTSHMDYMFNELKHLHTSKVHLKLPRFRMKATRSLVEPLKKLGLSTLFDFNSLVDLAAEPTKVADVKHQADISVDEVGTVAAAVTALQIVTLSLQPVARDIYFTVDQPFLGMIVDKQNSVPLFIFKAVDI
jgi:serpin B